MRYGFASLIPAARLAESAGLPSWLRYLNDFLILQGWGTYCCSVRMAHRRYDLAVIPAVPFMLSRMFFETGEGKRYFLIVVVTYILFRDRRPLRITLGFVASMIVMAAPAFERR